MKYLADAQGTRPHDCTQPCGLRHLIALSESPEPGTARDHRTDIFHALPLQSSQETNLVRHGEPDGKGHSRSCVCGWHLCRHHVWRCVGAFRVWCARPTLVPLHFLACAHCSHRVRAAVGSISQPSQQNLLVRAQSEDVSKMKPRLTKHPSGAFIPKAVPADK